LTPTWSWTCSSSANRTWPRARRFGTRSNPAGAEGYLAAHAITTIHYLAQKQLGSRRAKRVITSLLQVFEVAAVDGSVLVDALQHEAHDFEDAVSEAAARATGCEAIVTRDPKGFRTAGLPVLTPEAAAPLLAGR